jgi:hypothetical protein
VALPPALQRQADAVRAAFAPEAAAHAPAHLGLFRHLPIASEDSLARDVRALAAELGPAAFQLEPPTRWGDLWVAPVRSPALDSLREELAGRWHGLLSPGDFAAPRLHVSLGRRRETPPPLPPGPWRAPGLLLWQYGEACWTPLAAFGFRR